MNYILSKSEYGLSQTPIATQNRRVVLLQMFDFERFSTDWTVEVGPTPLVQAILMENMTANGLSDQTILAHLQQTYRAQLVVEIDYFFPIEILEFDFRHVLLEMVEGIGFRRASPRVKVPSSSPFVDQVSESDRESEKEAATDDEEQFSHKCPEIQQLHGHSHRNFDLAWLNKLHPQDKTLSFSISLQTELHEGSIQIYASLIYTVALPSGLSVLFCEYIDSAVVSPDVDELECIAFFVVAQSKRKQGVLLAIPDHLEKGVAAVCQIGRYLDPALHSEGFLRATADKPFVACTISIFQAMRIDRAGFSQTEGLILHDTGIAALINCQYSYSERRDEAETQHDKNRL